MGLFIRKSIEALQAEAKETGSGTLKRVLGPVSLVALGVGVIIGAVVALFCFGSGLFCLHREISECRLARLSRLGD